MSKAGRKSPAAVSSIVTNGISKSDWLLLAVTVPIAAVAMIFVLATLSPEVYWDFSPQVGNTSYAITSLGPAPTIWLTTLAIGLSAMAILVHTLLGGRIHIWPSLLLALGMAACLHHMPDHAGNLHRGAGWCAATAMALAIFHLAQHPKPRALMVACFAAMAIPMFFRAATWVFIEQPATVKDYLEKEQTYIQMHGWAWESAQHLSMRRRTLSPDYIGAVSLSNVQGTISAALAVLALGCALARRKLDRPAWLWLLLAGTAGITLIWTRSRGAILAAMLTAAYVALTWWISKQAEKGTKPPWRNGLRRYLPALALMLVTLAFAAVLVRGWMGPPADAQGERSLLFRYHYWQAAGRLMLQGWPNQALLGIGPSRFQQYSAAVKNPLNPEDVESVHNLQLDYLMTLGAGGLAWALLVATWLMTVTRMKETEPEPPDPPDAKSYRVPVLLVGIMSLGLDYALRWPTFLIESAILWVIGLVGFMAVGMYLAGACQRTAIRLGLIGAAIALVVHSQIDMAFFQPGSAIFAWSLLALAAGASATQSLRKSVLPGVIVGISMLALALTMAILWALPVSVQQTSLSLAARAIRQGSPQASLDYLTQAIDAVPTDPSPYRYRAQLLSELGYENLRSGRAVDGRKWFEMALDTLDQAEKRHVLGFSGMRMKAQILELGADPFKDAAWRNKALEIRRNLVQRQPYDLATRLDLANALWDANFQQDAAKEYQMVLQLSWQKYLDPLMMLPPERQEQLRDRIRQAGTPSTTPAIK